MRAIYCVIVIEFLHGAVYCRNKLFLTECQGNNFICT
jgi:hypothetical protein